MELSGVLDHRRGSFYVATTQFYYFSRLSITLCCFINLIPLKRGSFFLNYSSCKYLFSRGSLLLAYNELGHIILTINWSNSRNVKDPLQWNNRRQINRLCIEFAGSLFKHDTPLYYCCATSLIDEVLIPFMRFKANRFENHICIENPINIYTNMYSLLLFDLYTSI